ncbi:MAG TPA: hypothetical protein VEL11_07410 [Candidatus Bathyarchaeia archaeon]|nr:hypothetical protein [Candidatus Bathyarchaeia archaeon]
MAAGKLYIYQIAKTARVKVKQLKKIHHKGHTSVVLSVIFLFVGMIFVVPAITEKAMASIHATASGTCGSKGEVIPCILVWNHQNMFNGVFVKQPDKEPTTKATWSTAPKTAGWWEDGYVDYKFGGGLVRLEFVNPPAPSTNTCHVDVIQGGPGAASGNCKITQGARSVVTYELFSREMNSTPK